MDYQPKKRRSLTVPLPPTWLGVQLLIVIAVASLVWADHAQWQWFGGTAKDDEIARLERDVDRLKAALSNVADDVGKARSEAAVAHAAATTAQSAAAEARSGSGLTDYPELATVRMSSALAIVSLVQNKGGTQSSGSAQGQACIAWFLRGEGSATDCGFVHTDN